MLETVITIGRQYGSNGRRIGRQLAEALGLPFYDREKLRLVAVENGIGESLMESFGEKHASSLLYSLATGAYSFGYFDASQNASISQKAYLVAFEAVKRVAREGPCVIVGRCADYVLRDCVPCINVFVHAPFQARIATVSERLCIDGAEAEKKICERDRLRRSYYNYYTAKSWGDMDSYHLSVDSSLFGPEQTVELLRNHVLTPVQRMSQC